MKDSELIQKVHSGNKEAVGIIIERYYADIYRFCLYMVQTEDDAYDIAQETFLKFMKYGTSYKHHNLKGYLLTIARNICFNYFRDKKDKVTAIEWEEIYKIPNNKDMLTEAEDAVYLRNLLKELSQDTREVIILRIYEEMKFKDIAKIMGCSVSTTKSRFRLGVNQLKKEAVRKFNYSFTNGVYGLLGENGAGKTTLMRLICGVLQPTGGSIYCDNIEIASMGAEYRRLLGYLPQDFGYYGDFTAERFLRYMAALKALPEDYADSRIDELLDMVELKNVKKKKLKTFSGGMIRRIGIAQALLNNPEILILDEPTAGLDPKERVRFRNVISSLGKNRMVLLSTHIVSDIDYIADRILIMKNGELIQEGTEKEITDKVEGCVWKCIVSEKEAGQITSSFIVSNMRSSGENVELRIVSERQPVVGAENVESTLEDAYLYHTQITGGEKNATL